MTAESGDGLASSLEETPQLVALRAESLAEMALFQLDQEHGGVDEERDPQHAAVAWQVGNLSGGGAFVFTAMG